MISDWEGIDRITSPPHANYSYSVQAGVSAGIDMVSENQVISKCNMTNLIGYSVCKLPCGEHLRSYYFISF